MQLVEIEDILFNNKSLVFTAEDKKRMMDSFHYLKEFSKDKIIYGINTGFGHISISIKKVYIFISFNAFSI